MDEVTYRSSKPAQLVAFVLMLVCAGGMVSVLTLTDRPIGSRLAGAAFASAVAIYAYRSAIRPALHLTATDVIIVNRWQTVTFPIDDIAGAGGGPYLRLVRKSGPVEFVFAVAGRTTLNRYGGRSTRSGDVAREIELFLSRRR